jgi:predicted nucleotidyltransferase
LNSIKYKHYIDVTHEKEVYDNLTRVVGSEMDIRIRQNMFLIKDKIINKVDTLITQVSSGSLAEGLDLPGSDIDVMFVFNAVQVIQNVRHKLHILMASIFTLCK